MHHLEASSNGNRFSRTTSQTTFLSCPSFRMPLPPWSITVVDHSRLDFLKVARYVYQVSGKLIFAIITCMLLSMSHRNLQMFHAVTLAFLLCIVCVAEAIPLLNNFIQLRPSPTKASRVALMRLLLLDVALCYFAEYFSTFVFQHDIWKERNTKPILTSSSGKSSSNAADEEEKLLSEERQQNSTAVSLICILIFYFSTQILQ